MNKKDCDTYCDFQTMVMLLETSNSAGARRVDWGYKPESVIYLLENPLGGMGLYISNTLGCGGDTDIIGYGITYDDIKSVKWLVLDNSE